MATQMIMVQLAERQWMLEAMHAACMMARSTGAEVALMKMLPVQHLSWLGTDFGETNMLVQDYEDLHEYQATAEDYGVQMSSHIFQYATLIEALADAASYLDADVVFAKIPESRVALWHKLQVWQLRRLIEKEHRQVYTLDPQADLTPAKWTPTIPVPG